ncbi:MAG: hypothetical protein CBD74_07240 [Saprospirales bacterium TMED214]|nr:MAG: hypothetical protein CBD74_07240 [Saprospirales bacterium TMED214]
MGQFQANHFDGLRDELESALVGDATSSICIAPQGTSYSKVITNMEEVQAHAGPILANASQADPPVHKIADNLIQICRSMNFHNPS